MAQRIRHTDLTTVVTALVQSERLGANVSTMLSDLSTESREARILRAEELAAMLSNKLVFPLALCMLPALMIMIFGGVLAKFVP
jgi:tight adherence protein C